jgi:uncharacterized protein
MTLLSILFLFKLDKSLIFCILTLTIVLIDISIYLICKKIYKERKIVPFTLFNFHIILSIFSILILSWCFFFHNWSRNNVQFYFIFQISSNLCSFYFAKICFLIPVIISLLVKEHAKTIVKISLYFGLFSFIILQLSTLYGRFNFEQIQKNISLPIPKQLDNIKIVQLSDLHLGTFQGNKDKLEKIVEIINRQNPDLVFITGDIVNCYSEESIVFVDVLKKIKSKYGKYAVLGNHDYGDYYLWDNETEKINNKRLLEKQIQLMDFCLLNNENKKIIIKDTNLYVAGVENWGLPPYRQNADLSKALQGIDELSTVLLLSHDPVYWDEVVKFSKRVDITFSGHTHGYQFGIKLCDYYWSPFANKKPWYGYYKYNNSNLYVSKGLGGSFFPGRLGMWPEISIIILKAQ